MFRTINMAKSIIRHALKNENQNSIEIYLIIIIIFLCDMWRFFFLIFLQNLG